MKKVLGFLLLMFTVCIVFTTCKAGCEKTQRVVLIALDGISVEGFQQARIPNLDKLIGEGALSLNTRNVMPSVTLPNWTSHLTGSGPEQHGVVDNGWELNKYKLPPMLRDDEGYYPSIFQILKQQVPDIKTAFYYNWKNLIYPYNQAFLDEVSFEEDDGYIRNYEKALNFIVENKSVPSLVFLYSVHTDHAGHKYKWMSSEYILSIEEADVHIGEFLDKLKEQGLYEDTHFMFLTDHGGIGNGHGGVSTTEMEVPWAVTGPGIKKGFLLTEPNNTVNTAVTISSLFDCEPSASWIGKVPLSIFED